MGSKAIFIIFGVLSASQVVLGTLWEFGDKARGDEVIAHTEGRIGAYELSKTIKIHVPQCYDVTYVRVIVKNMVSTPLVKYNPYTQEVFIHYNRHQSSLSHYDVLARGLWRFGCNPHHRC